MNIYKDFKRAAEQKLNDFPMFFAFDTEQFNEGLQKLQCTQQELTRIPHGGFIRLRDLRAYQDLWSDYEAELSALLSTTEGFVDAVYYELCNHEYALTYDAQQALNVLGLDADELTPAQQELFMLAAQKCIDNTEL